MSSTFSSWLFILTSAGSNNKCLTVFAEQDKSVHCTDECRALGHSDRCWMPKLRVGSQADSADNRTNLFIPVGMDAMVETEIYGTISCSSRKTLSTFGKEQRDSTILVANVKPYLKSQRALSPPLQESPSASSSPTKGTMPLDFANQESTKEREGGSDSSAYGPPDGQCSPLHTELEEPSYLTCELRPKSLSSSLIHSSVISQECGGSDCALDSRDSGNWQVRWSCSLPPARGVMMISQINDQEVIFFDPQRCPHMHCITKNHLLCMFFEFVTCCVYVKYVSLTAVKVFGGKSALTWLHVFSWCTVPVNLDVCILHISSSNFVRVLNKLLLLSYWVLSAFVQWSFLSPFSV